MKNITAICCWTVIVTCLTSSGQLDSASTYPHMISLFHAFFPEHHIQLPSPSSSSPAASTVLAHTKCLGCGNNIRLVETGGDSAERNELSNSISNDLPGDDEDELLEVDVSNELTALRIEYIKKQILQKLRMTETPTVSVTDLPQPITESNAINDDYYSDSITDDYYGKTTQAIIFPYEDKARCTRNIRYPSACVPFQMPNDIHSSDVSSAQLWFHKERDILDSHNQTFIISEVAHWDTMRSFPKSKPIAIQETNLKEGWLKVDVAYVVRNWLDYQDSPTHAISVGCKTCGMDINDSPISFASSLKPFLVIYTHSQQRPQLRSAGRTVIGETVSAGGTFAQLPFAPPSPPSHRRSKRDTICSAESTGCCRDHLYVSFAEIGWNWIIEPAGYNAYFCKGSCSTAASIAFSGNQHNSIIQMLMERRHHKSSKKATALALELTPCCAAMHLQPLQLLFMQSNKTITTKILSNMIVTSCGCM